MISDYYTKSQIDSNIYTKTQTDSTFYNKTQIDSKFSQYTDYSTAEKVVGKWIDGKPVYSKSFEYSIPALGTGASDYSVPGSVIQNIKRVVKIEYSLHDNSNYSWGTGGSTTYQTNAWQHFTFWYGFPNRPDGKVGIWFAVNNNNNTSFMVSGNVTFVVMIYYTKTTD